MFKVIILYAERFRTYVPLQSDLNNKNNKKIF